MNIRRLSLPMLIILLALAVAACGGSSPTQAPVETQAPAPTNPPTQAAQPTETKPEPTLAPPTATALPPTQASAPSATAPMAEVIASATPIPATATPFVVTPLQRNLYLQTPYLSGDDVLLLQQALVARGYTEVGVPDGVFGPMTNTAVRRFQTDNNLVVDGIVGSTTWSMLFSGGLPTPAPTAAPTSQYSVTRRFQGFGAGKFIYDGDGMWIQSVKTMKLYNAETGEVTRQRSISVTYPSSDNPPVCYEDDRFYFAILHEIVLSTFVSETRYQIISLDIETKEEEIIIDLTDYMSFAIQPMACLDENFWLANGTYIAVIKPGNDAQPVLVRNVYLNGFIRDIVYGGGYMWVAEEWGAVHKIDPNSGRIVASYPYDATSLAYGGNRLWMASYDTGQVWSLDPETGKVVLAYTHEYPVGAIGCDGRYLWVAAYDDTYGGFQFYLLDIRER